MGVTVLVICSACGRELRPLKGDSYWFDRGGRPRCSPRCKEKSMSWKSEVLAQGEWCGNALRFATEEEALAYGRDLLSRWTVPVDHRAVEIEGEPTHAWGSDGVLTNLETGDGRKPARRVSL